MRGAVCDVGISLESIITIEFVFEFLVKVDAHGQPILLLLLGSIPILVTLAATSRLRLVVGESRKPSVFSGLGPILGHAEDVAWPLIHHRHL